MSTIQTDRAANTIRRVFKVAQTSGMGHADQLPDWVWHWVRQRMATADLDSLVEFCSDACAGHVGDFAATGWIWAHDMMHPTAAKRVIGNAVEGRRMKVFGTLNGKPAEWPYASAALISFHRDYKGDEDGFRIVPEEWTWAAANK